MSRHPRDQRSPEQIAKSMEIAKAKREQKKKEDIAKRINQGRIMLIIVGVLFSLSAGIEYYQSEVIEIFIFFGPIIVTYIILAILYDRNPFVIAIVGLSLYVLILALDAIFDPSTLLQGMLLKGAIIYLLLQAIKTAKDHKEAINRPSEVVDEDLLDQELV